jgi:hypothetical protein
MNQEPSGRQCCSKDTANRAIWLTLARKNADIEITTGSDMGCVYLSHLLYGVVWNWTTKRINIQHFIMDTVCHDSMVLTWRILIHSPPIAWNPPSICDSNIDCNLRWLTANLSFNKWPESRLSRSFLSRFKSWIHQVLSWTEK